MGIITIDYLLIAMGQAGATLDPALEAQYQYYIDRISAYVETYTGVSFTFHEDEVIRQQADYLGRINLKPKPVQAVGDVVAYANPGYATFYGYDGLETIYGVKPHGVYDVTLSYGYTEAPTDIQGYVADNVIDVINNPQLLSSYRVGDVTETYGAGGSSGGVLSAKQLGQAVLDSYAESEQTWNLGPHQFQPAPQLPVL